MYLTCTFSQACLNTIELKGGFNIDKTVEKIFVNGRFNNENKGKEISFVAVKDGRITKYGSDEELKKYSEEAKEIVDLKGNYVYPGFIDSHMHMIAYTQKKLYEIDLNNTVSKEELVKRVTDFIKEKNIEAGDWVIGAGWNQDTFEEKQLPDRYLLDKISTKHPIFLTRTCYHMCVVNSKALKAGVIDKKSKSPDGGQIDKDQNGIPTGILRENAMDLVANIIPGIKEKSKIKELIVRGCESLAEAGITTVHTDDFALVNDKRIMLEAFKELATANELPIRVVLQLRAAEVEDIICYEKMGLKSWDKINNLIIGPIKVLFDGSLGSRTAALDEEYADDKGNRGILLMSEKQFDEMVRESFKRNFDICVHAIGDRTMRIILDIYEKYYEIYKYKGFRPSIIHCQIGSYESLNKFKDLDVIANIQPIFLNTDWKIAESRIGKERLEYSYCWKKYLDMGIRCAGSSDAPIESIKPLYGIYSAVTRKDLDGNPEGGWIPEESISLKEAIDLFTINAAYLSHEEQVKGNIEIGKYADFVVLDEDLLKSNKNMVKDITVKNTIVGGNIVI